MASAIQQEVRKLRSLQLLRGVAVLLVVVLHIYAFEAQAGVGAGLLPSFSVFGSSGVDLFFVISGFVMVFTTSRLSSGASSFTTFLLKRALRIYPFYWLVTASLLIAYQLLPQFSARQSIEQVKLLEALLLLPQAVPPYLVVAWTLIHEVYFYLVFALFMLFPRRLLPYLLLLWLSSLLLFSGFATTALGALVVHPLTFEFIAGCYVALLLQNSPTRYYWALFGVGSAVLLIAWILYHQLNPGVALAGWSRALVFGVPYAMIVLAVTSAEVQGRFFRATWIERIGDASYSIYLLHFLVISVVSKVWLRIVPQFSESFLDNLAFILLSFVLSVLVGCLSYRYVESPLLAVMRRRIRFSVGVPFRRLA